MKVSADGKLKAGDRVEVDYTVAVDGQFPGYRGRQGTVGGVSRDGKVVYVCWDGNYTSSGWNIHFVKQVSPEK